MKLLLSLVDEIFFFQMYSKKSANSSSILMQNIVNIVAKSDWLAKNIITQNKISVYTYSISSVCWCSTGWIIWVLSVFVYDTNGNIFYLVGEP